MRSAGVFRLLIAAGIAHARRDLMTVTRHAPGDRQTDL
jgi:hypothetical protein